MIDPQNRLYLTHAKGLFSPTTLSKLYEHFKSCEGRSRQAKELSEREQKAIERGESSDEMRMQDLWYDAWREAPSQELLLDAVAPFTWVTFPVQVRHVRQENHNVPWHQDIGYMRLLGNRGHQQVITCFVPIEPNPAQCTTIEFATDNESAPETEYPHDHRDGFGAGLDGDKFHKRFHYDLALGDALVFGDFVLHRTYTPPNAQVERRSLEFRLIRPEDALPNKDYYDIARKQFVKTNEARMVANG